ncbi:CaiB/BaiF CoA transferase family protein [Novosphingobium sp. KACC 22771]|uniref:CaiB/BaiF CoA transferase family protein n=1 Tax=Novosphingobium sp. KACC 22771 TaxID=3025670 RepID=UPI0023652D7D|nr:CoA transferase [Novosphingobium sp. KACC 22771]WDF73975.1 CoA transferase [Novosphingobium sp. KACC 22771]
MTALTGLKIVDFSRFLPAAYASWVAADMGADVVRIEHPRELAKAEAMFGHDEDEAAALRRRARPSYTRGKRSLKINPGHEAARPVLEKLIARADVLIEDYRPGVMEGMGFGAGRMLALNPQLVYLSVSFAGQSGPLAGRAGHDPLALALAGALSRLNGLPAPSLPGLQVADVLTGAQGTIAMLLALSARDRSGRGQHVDVAMADACLPLLAVSMGRYDDPDAAPPPGAWHPKGGVWACADGQFLCTTDMEPTYWRRFCDAIGRPDFAAMQHALDQHPTMQEQIATLMRTRTRDEWAALLAQSDTQAMPVYSMAEAIAHPHHRARGRIVEVALPGQEPVTQLSLPFGLSETRSVPPRPAGHAGADNQAILTGLGFDPAMIAASGALDAGERH